MSEYNYGTYWISEVVDSDVLPIKSRLLMGSIVFGTVPNILALSYTILRWEHISLPFLLASAFGLLWLNIAPYLIWLYDERILPSFFEQIDEIVDSDEQADALAEKYIRMFSRTHLSVNVLLGVVGMSVVFAGQPVLLDQGMSGTGEIFLYTSYLYALYLGVVFGQGFVGTVVSILLIHELAELTLKIDPLHPDQLGGLSSVGYLSIRTTVLFSTSTLFFPLLFRLSENSPHQWVVGLFVGFVVVSIAASFLFPTFRINQAAKNRRYEILNELRAEYYQTRMELLNKTGRIERTADSPMSLTDMATQTMKRGIENDELDFNQKESGLQNGDWMELERIRREYDLYKNVRLYPMQIDILWRLIGSILLPIVFVLFEVFVIQLF